MYFTALHSTALRCPAVLLQFSLRNVSSLNGVCPAGQGPEWPLYWGGKYSQIPLFFLRRPENGSLGELDKREVSKHRWWANVGSSQNARDVAGKETVRWRFRKLNDAKRFNVSNMQNFFLFPNLF